MATYDLTQNIPSNIATGDIFNCPYSGTYKTITLPAGIYKLQCWGALGGRNAVLNSSVGGKGGYSEGIVTLNNSTNIYIYTGGKGSDSISTTKIDMDGGFNGGGSNRNYDGTAYAGTGGGASDIRIGQNSLYARIIVAGGGGGGGSHNNHSYTGGAGGGTSGLQGVSYSSSYTKAGGGTQTSGGTRGTNSNYSLQGSFGLGGNQTATSNGWLACGGGGGWYGGGSGAAVGSGGGGGSGYVYTSSTASNYPSGCLLTSDLYLSDTQNIAGDSSMPSTSGSTETGHSGNGYVRITVISIISSGLPFKVKQSDEWKEISKGYVKVSDEWKEINKVFHKDNGQWIED